MRESVSRVCFCVRERELETMGLLLLIGREKICEGERERDGLEKVDKKRAVDHHTKERERKKERWIVHL